MALQVTGSFKLTNGTFAVDPQILMIPTLPYRGTLNLQAQIVISESTSMPGPALNGYYMVDNLYYNNINITALTSSLENPYSSLIDSLDHYVKADLEVNQPNCTYNIF